MKREMSTKILSLIVQSETALTLFFLKYVVSYSDYLFKNIIRKRINFKVVNYFNY